MVFVNPVTYNITNGERGSLVIYVWGNTHASLEICVQEIRSPGKLETHHCDTVVALIFVITSYVASVSKLPW